MLTADNVWFGYGAVPVLQGVGVRLAPGSLVGILGPNGSGKTTILKVLAGALGPSAGRVTLDGADLARLPRRALARRLAVVPQETHLAFDYTVLEIALMGRYPHLGPFELEGPGDLAMARAALAATGTLAFEHRLYSRLSGGEKQRVVIAAALAQFGAAPDEHDREPAAGSTRVLLLDEPTASLDLRYQLEIVQLLARLNREQGMAMAICTHDLHLAARLCREVVLLRDGRVLAVGPTGDVLTAEHIRATYDVEVDVRRDPDHGLSFVVPALAEDSSAGSPAVAHHAGSRGRE